MNIEELLKTHKMATGEDLLCVLEMIQRNPSLVIIRDVNGGSIEEFTHYATGPFSIQSDEEGLYICGYDHRDKQERHLRIIDNGETKGVVELRHPNQPWHQPQFGAIRVYMHK